MKAENKIAYLEHLRILSMICVIIMHVSAGMLSDPIDLSWQGFNILTSISFVAVPIFFMISGVVLLESAHTESVAYTWKKRLPKLILPLVAWSMVAILVNFCSPESLANGFAWKEFLKVILTIPSRNVAVHLWFMYFLIPIYLISPFLKVMIDSMKKEHVKYLFFLWGVIVILSTINGFLPSSLQSYAHLDLFERINFIGGYLFYFLAGHYLHHMEKSISNRNLVILFLTCTVIVIVGTSCLSMYNEAYTNTFQSVNYIFIVLMSISLFLLAKQNSKPKELSKTVTFFATASFGVYLMHNIFISILYNYIWKYTDFIGGVIAMMITLCVCSFVVMLLSSIKPFSFLFTGVNYRSACKKCNIFYLIKQKD